MTEKNGKNRKHIDTVPFAEDGDANEMYYVGVGASAGGLEALEALFKEMPDDTGMAFIVIQHLSPDYKSLMNELLSRRTAMPVVIAENGMRVQADTIYLNSPGNDITIENGIFIVHSHVEQKSLNLPINLFFRSLAADQGKHAIAIVLSGTGSDGTLGIRAIKEAGGIIIAQDDQTAKFDGMPRSSISTGLVDLVLPPQEMGAELINYIRHPYIKEHLLDSEVSTNTQKSNTFSRILTLLKSYCGIDFFSYKENTILRRLERRVSVNRLNSLDDYYLMLVESDKEKETLYRELLIGVTNFFRDKEAFTFLEKNVIPNLCYEKKIIRVWCAACSTGEEAYSVAMLIQNYIDTNQIECDLKIFATDLEGSSLDFAGRGIYSESVVSDIDQELLEKYFTRKENAYQIKDAIRNLVVFANHNILKDPPFSKLDLLVCRNLFIYLKPEIQQKLLSMFYYSLQSKGYLFMGSSESIGEMSNAYRVMDSKWKIYQCREGYRKAQTLSIFSMPEHITGEDFFGSGSIAAKKLKMEKVVEKAMASVLPPTLLLDENFNIVHVVNDVNYFLDVKPGQFSTSIFSNISGDLSLFVSSILRRLKSKDKTVISEHISGLKNFQGKSVMIKGYTVEYQQYPFYMLTFEADEQTAKPDIDYNIDSNDIVNARIIELEKELMIGKENLQATVEELETSNEELQSSNEELIASNEELQSTNEELQSVNEELYTVNSEYQSKIEELSCMTEDLDNLLIIAEIGALYLDCKFCIRKITPIMSKVTNIMPTDIGRPIYHISFMDNYPELVDDVRGVLETLTPYEREICDLREHTWLVRIRPYRTDTYAVDGVLLTLVDISNSKQMEQEFDNMVVRYDRQENDTVERERLIRRMLDGTSSMKMFADERQKMQYANSAARKFFFGDSQERSEREHGWEIPPGLREIYVRVKTSGIIQNHVYLELLNYENQKKKVLVTADISKTESGEFAGVLFSMVEET